MKHKRNTRQRQLVLDVVRARRDHPNAEQIYLQVREWDDKISRSTVYRNLNMLAEEGKIRHVVMPDSDRFDCRTDLHYHLLCARCGKLCDTPMDYRGELDRELADRTGYEIMYHRTTFLGICPECMEKE